jgi:hypothetical protein
MPSEDRLSGDSTPPANLLGPITVYGKTSTPNGIIPTAVDHVPVELDAGGEQ